MTSQFLLEAGLQKMHQICKLELASISSGNVVHRVFSKHRMCNAYYQPTNMDAQVY
jgi:hypothetical protein